MLQLILSLQRENQTTSACDSKLDISHTVQKWFNFVCD